ncbi:hypothetical protein D3C79_681020 [compost metagenome]
MMAETSSASTNQSRPSEYGVWPMVSVWMLVPPRNIASPAALMPVKPRRLRLLRRMFRVPRAKARISPISSTVRAKCTL